MEKDAISLVDHLGWSKAHVFGMLQNPEYRKQLQDMLNNMGGSQEWDSRMMDTMQNFDISSLKVKQQFDQIGLTPEEVISKIMANPDVALAFQNPKVQAAIMDVCSGSILPFLMPLKVSDDEEDTDMQPGITEFIEGCRTFRMAFVTIMKKHIDDDLGPILSAQKKLVVAKLAEEDDEKKVKSEAKKVKQMVAEKGHVKLAKSYIDPHEKLLIGVATKGVVKLLNAVNKAQSAQKGLNPSRTKDAKVLKQRRKQVFFKELNKSSGQSTEGDNKMVDAVVRKIQNDFSSALVSPGVQLGILLKKILESEITSLSNEELLDGISKYLNKQVASVGSDSSEFCICGGRAEMINFTLLSNEELSDAITEYLCKKDVSEM